jgi:hypothetical protein
MSFKSHWQLLLIPVVIAGCHGPSFSGARTAEAMSTRGDSSVSVPVNQEQVILKAGSVDDNSDYAGYIKFLGLGQGLVDSKKVRDLQLKMRQWISIEDKNEDAIPNATININNGQIRLKTYANGQTLFNSEPDGQYNVTVTTNNYSKTVQLTSNPTKPWIIKLDTTKPQQQTPTIEIAYIIDATGSMGGEIKKLQATLSDVASRIGQMPGNPELKFGLVSYRDQGDDYVTKVTNFTKDLGVFSTALSTVSANGGGDQPEDLESALSVATRELSWGDSAQTIRLAYVVADAEAHVHYPNSTSYLESVKIAKEKGIKFHMIGASGLNQTGEYQYRQIAQQTLGKYIFITRGGDAGQGGGEAASKTVDQYQESRLDNIIVNSVKDELNNWQ